MTTPLHPSSFILHPSPRAVGYIRGSTRDQKATLYAQYEAIVRYCKAYDKVLDDSIRRTVQLEDGTVELIGCFVDAGVSAEKVDFLQRPDAALMIEHLAATGIKEIIGTKLDRVFRDVDDCRFTVPNLERHGVFFRLLDIGGDMVTTSTPMGKFMLTVMAAVAEFDNGRRKERVRDTINCHIRRRAATGRGIVLGNIGYGWMLVDGDNTDGQKIQVHHPDEWPILLRIVNGDLSAISDNEAARHLNAENIPAKKGGKWSGKSIASVRAHAHLSEPQSLAA